MTILAFVTEEKAAQRSMIMNCLLRLQVFRTYNASRTLEEELQKLTEPDDPLPAKILSYNRANRYAVAAAEW